MNKIITTYYGLNTKRILAEYAAHFEVNFDSKQDSSTIFNGFCGRILRGSSDNEFTTLADNQSRQIVFFLDAVALNRFIGLDGFEILKQVGYPISFIIKLTRQGTKFKLFLTEETELLRATWDNLLDIVQLLYPEWKTRIRVARPFLKELSYLEIMSSPGIVREVRLFLQDMLNVNHLFAGDGYTRSEGLESIQNHAEYFTINKKLSEFNSYALIEFPINIS